MQNQRSSSFSGRFVAIATVFATAIVVSRLHPHLAYLILAIGWGSMAAHDWRQLRHNQHVLSHLHEERDHDRVNHETLLADYQAELTRYQSKQQTNDRKIEAYKRKVASLTRRLRQAKQSDKRSQNELTKLSQSYQQMTTQTTTYAQVIADLQAELEKKESIAHQPARTSLHQSVPDSLDPEPEPKSISAKITALRSKTHYTLDDLSFMGNMITILLPNVEFLRDSLMILLKKLKNPLRVLQQIKTISEGNARGERVESTTQKWLEQHVHGNRDWRIYFRARPPQSTYQILIATKRSQKLDMAWLERQS